MRLSLFLLSVGLASHALGVKMSERFTVSSTCDNTKMDAMLTESISMTENAIAALDKLQGSLLFANKELVNLIEAGVTAWGVASPGFLTRSFGADDKARLKKAQDKYKSLLAALKDGTNMSPSQNYLFCDSTTLQWTTKASDIFTKAPSGQTIEDYFSSVQKGVKGIWKDPDNKNGDDFNWIVDEYNGGPMCGPKAAEAITYRQSPKSMFLCPALLDGKTYKTSIEGNRKDTDKKVWADIQNIPGVFIHEMMHWLDLKPASEHVTDEKIVDPGTGKPTTAYGMMAVWLLAGNLEGDTGNAGKKGNTVTNADSYHVFATMAYIPGSDFFPYAD